MTVLSSLIVTVQVVAVVESQPVKPTRIEFSSGVPVIVTSVPWS